MIFLQPIILFALPLIAVPVLIHLLNRLRFHTRYWGAMMFLLDANRTSSRLSHWRHFLVLALRTLAVLLLILAVSRPLISRIFGFRFKGKLDTVIILLDRSASMQVKPKGQERTLQQQTLAQLTQALESLGSDVSVVLIDSVTEVPQDLESVKALTDLEMVTGTSTHADIPSMLIAAADYCAEGLDGVNEVWLVSDLQGEDWRPESVAWHEIRERFQAMQSPPVFRLFTCDTRSSNNLSLTLLNAYREVTPEGDSLTLRMRIVAPGHSRTTLPLTVSMNDTSRQIDALLDSANTILVEKIPLAKDDNGGWGSVKLPPDTNLIDNEIFFAYGDLEQINTVIVAQESRVGHLLSLMAAPFGKNARQHAMYLPSLNGNGQSLPDLSDVALVIWQRPLPGPDHRLLTYVQNGGHALLLPPLRGKNNQRVFAGFQWSEIKATEQPLVPVEWQRKDGALADGASGHALPLAQVRVHQYRQPIGEAVDLASFGQAELPLLRRAKVGKGTVHFLATLPHQAWSNLAGGGALVPMIHRLSRAGSVRLQNVTLAECGHWKPRASSNLVEAAEQPDKHFRTHAGLYHYKGKRLALNVSASEAARQRLSVQDVKTRFDGLVVKLLQQNTQQTANNGHRELWAVMLWVMLACLLLERIFTMPPPQAQTEGSLDV